MTLRVVQMPSLADELDILLTPGMRGLPLREGLEPHTPDGPRDGAVWSARCSCGAPKQRGKVYCSSHPKRLRLL